MRVGTLVLVPLRKKSMLQHQRNSAMPLCLCLCTAAYVQHAAQLVMQPTRPLLSSPPFPVVVPPLCSRGGAVAGAGPQAAPDAGAADTPGAPGPGPKQHRHHPRVHGTHREGAQR
jgi:hypothetical protein